MTGLAVLMTSPGMQAFLESAEINASDAWTLFASLDVDGDNATWCKAWRGVSPTKEATDLGKVLGRL